MAAVEKKCTVQLVWNRGLTLGSDWVGLLCWTALQGLLQGGFLPLPNAASSDWLLTYCFPDTLCPRFSWLHFLLHLANVYLLVGAQWKDYFQQKVLLDYISSYIHFCLHQWNWPSVYNYHTMERSTVWGISQVVTITRMSSSMTSLIQLRWSAGISSSTMMMWW